MCVLETRCNIGQDYGDINSRMTFSFFERQETESVPFGSLKIKGNTDRQPKKKNICEIFQARFYNLIPDTMIETLQIKKRT